MKRVLLFGLCLLCVVGAALAARELLREEQVYDASSMDTVIAWDALIQQPTEGRGAEALLAEFAALPQPSDRLQAAQIWALAIQRRNGYAQFALLDEASQQSQRIRYEAAGWVSGVSSPWVESFDIVGKDGEYKIGFALNTSAGEYGSFMVGLNIECNDDICRITKIEALEGEAQPYILSLLD